MTLKYALITSVFACVLISCASNQDIDNHLIGPVLETQYGLVEGVNNETNTVVSFKGVPYASPPVGDFRWRAPQPAAPWNGIRTAHEFGPSAMQIKRYSANPHTEEFMVQDNISEDCLFLNIWTPATSTEDKLPVFVFIHGGGFNEGSGSVAVYDGEELAKKGVVAITINYRLLALGFLAHPELTEESPNHSSGNYGFLDQIAALKWIRNNIINFGGDPECVTIAGQSAGASSVNTLICSPLASGLFHRAITQSGTRFAGGYGTLKTLEEAEEQGVEFARLKGASSIAELRAISAEKIIAPTPEKYIRFGGNIDGYVQLEDMKTVFAKGYQNDTPFMTGLNADETRYKGVENNEFKALYPLDSEEEREIALKTAGQEQGRLNAWLWLDYRSKTATTDGYAYYFDRAIPWPEHPEFGAFHTAEVPYVFNNMNKITSHTMEKMDTLIADKISSYWVNFIKTGDPNGPGLEKWVPYREGKHEVMRIGEGFGMIPIAASERRFDFLRDQLLK